MTRENRESGFLERNFVVIIKIVEPDNLIAALEQDLRDMKPDESGSAL
jgi:hypothetical protein